MNNLLEVITPVTIANPAAAGTSLITSSALDTAGYDGVQFIVSLGAVTDNCVLTLTPLVNATNSNSGGTAITNATTAAFTAATSSNTLIVSDVIKPSKRYVYCTLGRTTQNAVLNCIIAVLYRPRTIPTVQAAANVIASAIGGAI